MRRLAFFCLLLGSAANAAVMPSACAADERARLIYRGGQPQLLLPDRYARLTELYARGHGIPVILFAAQLWQESHYCHEARSHAGAIGLGQLMPATAAELGVDPYDMHQNVAGAAKYLAQQKRRYGTWELALAAYNAGPGAVRRWGGVPPYLETQHYVRSILMLSRDLKVAGG